MTVFELVLPALMGVVIAAILVTALRHPHEPEPRPSIEAGHLPGADAEDTVEWD